MQAFLYVYLLGLVPFLAGLWVGWRQGYLSLGGAGRRRLLVYLGVFLFFLLLQGTLQFAPMAEAPARLAAGEAKTGGRIRGHWLDYAIMVAYFLGILYVGTWFARRNRTTRDFFFGGQRFSWWLIAFSLVATTVGSYSFVKYSEVGFKYGLGSTQSYLNDWIWLPLLALGWLPILYFSRATSVPEYLGRRFGPAVRLTATALILLYLVGYIGVNLFTMGLVLHHLVGWPVFAAALLAAAVSAAYVTAGGQTSVIMTDLFQGLMLMAAGGLILVLGIDRLGGLDAFWRHLPREARLAFPSFNQAPDLPAAGVFWQDALANSGMFYFLHQGILMRFLAARSVAEGRKAAVATVLVLMTLAAAVVAGGGWVARALVHSGQLPAELDSKEAFYAATELLCRPGVFGLVLAALTAALMSTVDTLVTAVAAITVNDLYRPYVRPAARDAELLKAARIASLLVSALGLALVPVFMQFDTIYQAHAAFTAAVTPPLVVTILGSVFWRRFTRAAALMTMLGGTAAVLLSVLVPDVITPFAHGVPMGEAKGVLPGLAQHTFMRACFGLAASTAIALLVAWRTRPEPWERQRGLVWGTVADALRHYKGSPGREGEVRRALALPGALPVEPPRVGAGELPQVVLSRRLAEELGAGPGDLVFVTDRRAWLGGLRSVHAVAAEGGEDGGERRLWLGPEVHPLVVSPRRRGKPLLVERLY